MRVAAIIFIFIASLQGTFAYEAPSVNEVWIDGTNFYTSIKHKKKATIYFENWSFYTNKYLEDDNYFVAFQLTKSFDVFMEDDQELPSLEVLSFISDQNTLKTYLKFFIDFNRTKGVTHLVLPDTSSLNPFEKEVIDLAYNTQPGFFIHKNQLDYNLPENKTEFQALGSLDKIFIAKQDVDTRRLERWSRENTQKNQLIRNIRRSRSSTFSLKYNFPEELKSSIFEKTIIALDPQELLPIKSKKITYMGKDENLIAYLEKYVEVIGYRTENYPVITDLRHGNERAHRDDFVLTNKQTNYSSALILPINVSHENYHISRVLFGSAFVEGRIHGKESRKLFAQKVLFYPSKEVSSESWHDSIDSLMKVAIKKYATPGGQIAIVKGHEVVYEKSYGYFTYDSMRSVGQNTLYDLASLTKVLATLPSIAILIDEGSLKLDDPLSKHLEIFQNTNKSDITVRQLLAHNGGLKSYVPFWKLAVDGDRLDPFYYKNEEDKKNDIRTYGFQPDPTLKDTLQSWLVHSNLEKDPTEYNYSDLGFMILHLIVEEVSGLSFEEFVTKRIIEPLGLHYLTFNPLDKGFLFEDIAPTEFDKRYRNYQVWGEVHDRNATVFGGASGHAGLFANASNVAILMKMLMNDGLYGNHQLVDAQVLKAFNVRYFNNNRRGLGWDKLDEKKDLLPSPLADDSSFGHSGFSGTMVWADPKNDLLFVFLSNRIYPDAANRRLSILNTRTKLHTAAYKGLVQGR